MFTYEREARFMFEKRLVLSVEALLSTSQSLKAPGFCFKWSLKSSLPSTRDYSLVAPQWIKHLQFQASFRSVEMR